MLATFAQKGMNGSITTKTREALLDTVVRMHCLIEAYPVQDTPAEPEAPTVH